MHLIDNMPESTFFIQWHMFPEQGEGGNQLNVERERDIWWKMLKRR
jgi:hypothetical protein